MASGGGNGSSAAASNPLIVVDSLDMDGCVFHENYLRTILDNCKGFQYTEDIVKHNPGLIGFLVKTEEDAQHILMLGTNRQDFETDQQNSCSRHTISGPNALTQIASRLEKNHHPCTVNKFMMVEVYHPDLPSGAVFDSILIKDQTHLRAAAEAASPTAAAAMARSKHRHRTPKEEARATFDASKITLLYAQMHKIASENPSSQIVYRFHDDKREILQGLRRVFAARPDLIPHNVTLECYAYKGRETIAGPAEPTLPPADDLLPKRIKGTGAIDSSYAVTIRNIASSSQLSKNPAEPTPQEHMERLLPHLPGTPKLALTRESDAGKLLALYALTEYRRIGDDTDKGCQFLDLANNINKALYTSPTSLKQQIPEFLHRLRAIAYKKRDGRRSEESQSAENFRAFIKHPIIAPHCEVEAEKGGSRLKYTRRNPETHIEETATVYPRDAYEEGLFSRPMSIFDLAALVQDRHDRTSFVFKPAETAATPTVCPSHT